MFGLFLPHGIIQHCLNEPPQLLMWPHETHIQSKTGIRAGTGHASCTDQTRRNFWKTISWNKYFRDGKMVLGDYANEVKNPEDSDKHVGADDWSIKAHFMDNTTSYFQITRSFCTSNSLQRFLAGAVCVCIYIYIYVDNQQSFYFLLLLKGVF